MKPDIRRTYSYPEVVRLTGCTLQALDWTCALVAGVGPGGTNDLRFQATSMTIGDIARLLKRSRQSMYHHGRGGRKFIDLLPIVSERRKTFIFLPRSGRKRRQA